MTIDNWKTSSLKLVFPLLPPLQGVSRLVDKTLEKFYWQNKIEENDANKIISHR